MSIISKGVSAIGKLGVVILLFGAFLTGMAGVVYMSLTGTEMKVPEIVGKDFVETEKELASLGLKIKKRADRVSTEPINTVLEQLPKAGETVKTGQMILVVVSKAGLAGEETPSSLKKDIETDDSEKIEEMISDKPKRKSNSNANTNKKKADTTRDVIAGETSSNTAVDSKAASNSKAGDTAGDKNREPAGGTPPKQPNAPAVKPGSEPRPKP